MEKTFRSSAAFWRRFAELRFDVALSFQAVKSGINGADGHFATSPCFDLLPHCNPIGPTSKTKEGQNHDVLEFTEIIAARH